MAHNHNIADTDLHFSIDPITRVIKDESAVKKSLVQFDHNSERVAFDLPRKIENHDMTECNRVEIHYINISSSDSYEGVYEVTDLKASEDENTATFTWLISQNATRIAGSLNFLIRFACVEDGVVKYLWNTKIFKGIAVSDGMDNGDVVVEQYADILNEWWNKLNKRSARIGYVTLSASDWVGDASPYSQVVGVDGVTEYTQVDLTPSVEQLAVFHQKDLAFVTENEDGVVTVYAIGQKPENDYTIQVTMTEVQL
jgi:hypothetical protein